MSEREPDGSPALSPGAPCPCGSGATYRACCGPRHDGSRPAETPEALMRSRYSAFAAGDGAYLLATDASSPEDPQVRGELERWAKSVTWLRLEVREVSASEDPLEGFVAFTAWYLEGDSVVSLAERSLFRRLDGRWKYLGGESQVRRAKAPRNDPCPCGSGRKFKHCHA